MTENQQNEKEKGHDVNLQFINRVRRDIILDPKTQSVAIMRRDEDASVYTITDEENVLLSFSSS